MELPQWRGFNAARRGHPVAGRALVAAVRQPVARAVFAGFCTVRSKLQSGNTRRGPTFDKRRQCGVAVRRAEHRSPGARRADEALHVPVAGSRKFGRQVR